ncbi:MAG TPA: cytochrome P450 [Bryobacteraceae bacterium]|jgi:pulcherriminic acid synthase|nr:cytochrome P450 [Bryobacteraceae bacterium]
MTPPDIFSPEFARDPYPLYRIMRDEFPLYFHPGANAYVLSRYEDIRLALTNPEFTTRSYAAQIEPLLGVTVVQLDGSEHARQRRLLAAPFRADRFNTAFARAIDKIADRLAEGFADRDTVELVKEFITPFSVAALAAVVGLPQSDLGLFRSWYTALLRFGVNLVGDPEVTRAGFAARDELSVYLRPLVKTHRQSAGTGLLSMLVHAEVEGQRLTDDEIVHFAMLMIFAGGETVEKTLATFLRNLVAHPDQMAALQADWTLFERALAESLRFTAPTHMIPRRTRSEVAVSGGTIPAEAEVVCFLASANRDERRFTDPDRFDIFRTDLDVESAFTTTARHAAFGMGRHFCLGAMMARIEVEIAVKRLLLASPGNICFADGVPPPDQGLFLRGPATLPLRFAAQERN